MNRLSTVGILATALIWTRLAAAAPVPGTPTNLLEADAVTRAQLRLGASGKAQTNVVDVTGQPFSKALRVKTLQQAPLTLENLVVWRSAVEVTLPVHGTFDHNDAVLATFWVRCVESPETSGETTMTIRLGGLSGYEIGGLPFKAGKEWRKVQYPIKVISSYSRQRPNPATGSPLRELELAIATGHGLQTIEIGGIELVNYAKTKRVSELPITSLGYEGREADAPWRKEAEQRIEQNRKADLTVVVQDQSGRPLENASVAVKMRKHAFGFGAAVNGPTLTGRAWPADGQKYKDAIIRLFNKTVVENDLKWSGWEAVDNRPATFQFIDWMTNSGVPVRGHNLVWPAWGKSPRRLRDLQNDKAALAKAILDHIDEETRALRGRLVEWDVINEPFFNHDIIDVLGQECMVDWFKAAHRGDPDAKLYINDYDILESFDAPHREAYAKTIQYLIDQGAPIDGIGMQGHFSAIVTPPAEVYRRIERFAAFKKDLEVTEFDINTNDELLQADYTRDFLTVCYSHPAFVGFMMWGFWEPNHWLPRGAMINDDWTTKPNYDAYMDLVYKKWWTNANGTTGAKGTYAVRGFLGDYTIEVRAGGQTKTLQISLPKGGRTVQCAM